MASHGSDEGRTWWAHELKMGSVRGCEFVRNGRGEVRVGEEECGRREYVRNSVDGGACADPRQRRGAGARARIAGARDTG